MKVKITAESKRVITMAQADIAKQIVSDMKEDEMSAADYAEYAVNCFLRNTERSRENNDYCEKVLSAEARIAGNCRVWNAYSNDSASLDVWIEALAKTRYGFLEIDFYLSDVWQIGPDEFNRTFPGKVYARYFLEA